MYAVGDGQINGLETGMEGLPAGPGFEVEVSGVVESLGEGDGATGGVGGEEHLESHVLFVADGQRRSDCGSAVTGQVANGIRIEDEVEEA